MTHAPFSSADPRKQIPFRKAQALPEASSRVVQNFVAFAQGTKRGLA
jgi:hypothetical protein